MIFQHLFLHCNNSEVLIQLPVDAIMFQIKKTVCVQIIRAVILVCSSEAPFCFLYPVLDIDATFLCFNISFKHNEKGLWFPNSFTTSKDNVSTEKALGFWKIRRLKASSIMTRGLFLFLFGFGFGFEQCKNPVNYW